MNSVPREKGKSIILFPNDYVLVDVETTGLSADYDSILEIAALRVIDGVVQSEFHTFLAYDGSIPPFVTFLTGITEEMLIGAPKPNEAIKLFYDFLGDSIIVGYNVNFDVNFLYDYCLKYLGIKMKNDFVDCMRISRKLFPDEKHHRLMDMVRLLNISAEGFHRALVDCYTTKSVFDNLRLLVLEKYPSEAELYSTFVNKYRRNGYPKKVNAKDIVCESTEFDTTHPLYGKNCVFTGTLEKMVRRDAMQCVVNLGGIVENNVTQKTNFLILGNNDYCSTIKGGKSSKQVKAEELIKKGNDLSIIAENDFYDLIDL